MNKLPVFLLQLFLGVCLIFLLPSLGWAATVTPDSQAQTVLGIEDALFGIHYNQDKLDTRVTRLEQTVFGQASAANVPIDSRISKLKTVLSSGTLGPLSPTASSAAKPGSNVQAQSPSVQKKPTQAANKPSSPLSTVVQTPKSALSTTPLAGETDYPTVSQMEQKLFGKTFVKEDITLRLSRLEKQVFKITQNGGLADRVDNLRLVVLGDTDTGGPASSVSSAIPGYGNTQQLPQYSPINSTTGVSGTQVYQNPYGGSVAASSPRGSTGGISPSPYASPQQYGSQVSYYSPAAAGGGVNNTAGAPTPDMLAAMSEVEKEVLGNTFPAEPINSRLDRVETKVFHSTSPEMSSEDRMQRVISVASAGGAPPTARARAKSTFQTLLPIILTILPMVLL